MKLIDSVLFNTFLEELELIPLLDTWFQGSGMLLVRPEAMLSPMFMSGASSMSFVFMMFVPFTQ